MDILAIRDLDTQDIAVLVPVGIRGSLGLELLDIPGTADSPVTRGSADSRATVDIQEAAFQGTLGTRGAE